MSFINKVEQPLLGNILGLTISLYNIFQSKIQTNNKKSWIYLQDILRILSLFCISFIGSFFIENKYNSIGVYFLLGLFDYLGTFFINKGYQLAPSYLMYFMDQLIFLIDVSIKLVIYREFVNYKLLILYTVLLFTNLINNYTPDSKGSIIYGIVFGLLSNFSFLGFIYLQEYVLGGSNLLTLYMCTTPFMVVIGFTIACVFNYKNRPRDLSEIRDYYKSNYKHLILCTLSGVSLYFGESLIIEMYGPHSFNIALLVFSSYTGIIECIKKYTHRRMCIGLVGIAICTVMFSLKF